MADKTAGIQQLGVATDAMPLGTVLASILPPAAFIAHALPAHAWVLADGNALPNQNSELATFMKLNRDTDYDATIVQGDIAKVPDLRGVFLRGVNEARDPSTGDTDPARKIGNYQKDQFSAHTHTVGYTTQVIEQGNGAPAPRSTPPSSPYSTGPTGAGTETRPRNVAVYFYVKIA
jgi:hypothetical protein